MAQGTIIIRFGDDDQQEYEFSQKSDVSEEVPLYLLEAAHLIKINKDPDFDFESIPENDPFTTHEVLYGGFDDVYQMNSVGAECFKAFIVPESISDYLDILALDCPGPLMAGITFEYMERRQSSLPPQYIHPKLKPVLSSTYGLVLYRKQVIEIAGCIAGYTQEEQCALKTTLDECKPGELSGHKNRFMDGAVSNWVDATTAEAIFKQIAFFSSYDFYDEWQTSEHAILAYRSAYMRHSYPEDYQTALDNTRIDRQAEKETVVKAPEDLNPLVFRYIKAKLAGQQYQQKTSDQLSRY